MKTASLSVRSKKGFTLLEMTIVIMVLLTLVGIGLLTSTKMDQWKLGRAASETLRTVYSAQRLYLADNPTRLVPELTEAMLIPLLPKRNTPGPAPTNLVTALGTVRSLGGGDLAFNITVSPPQFTLGGVRYDPSGGLTDSLWDVGE